MEIANLLHKRGLNNSELSTFVLQRVRGKRLLVSEINFRNVCSFFSAVTNESTNGKVMKLSTSGFTNSTSVFVKGKQIIFFCEIIVNIFSQTEISDSLQHFR